MLNIHLNGDIVRCPDIKEIHKRAQQVRDEHRICKFNYKESGCPVWLSAVNTHKYSGRCSLFCSEDCPGRKRQIEHGRKQKTYKIDNKTYRKIASGAHLMVKASKHKTLFVTLTYPPFKRKYNEKEINQSFSRFIHNLHENYGVKNYIAVKEYCKNNNRPHFHLLLSIRYTDFAILNSAWNHAISDICFFSRNAFSTKKDHVIIRNPARAMRYACKYFSKTRGSVSATKLVFIANNLLSHIEETHVIDRDGVILNTIKKRVSNIQKSSHGYYADILKGYKGIFIQQTSDYTTCFRITDPAEFNRFCNNYLYHLFDLGLKDSDFTALTDSKN